MAEASDHSYIPHDSYFCSRNVQVVYHSVLSDGDGLLVLSDGPSGGYACFLFFVLFFVHLVEASV